MTANEIYEYDSIIKGIINLILDRDRVSTEKSGKNFKNDDLSLLDWIQNTQEKHIDAISYLEKIKQDYQRLEKEKQKLNEDIEALKIELQKRSQFSL